MPASAGARRRRNPPAHVAHRRPHKRIIRRVLRLVCACVPPAREVHRKASAALAGGSRTCRDTVLPLPTTPTARRHLVGRRSQPTEQSGRGEAGRCRGFALAAVAHARQLARAAGWPSSPNGGVGVLLPGRGAAPAVPMPAARDAPLTSRTRHWCVGLRTPRKGVTGPGVSWQQRTRCPAQVVIRTALARQHPAPQGDEATCRLPAGRGRGAAGPRCSCPGRCRSPRSPARGAPVTQAHCLGVWGSQRCGDEVSHRRGSGRFRAGERHRQVVCPRVLIRNSLRSRPGGWAAATAPAAQRQRALVGTEGCGCRRAAGG